MMLCSLLSTSPAVHNRRMAFCDISRPLTATPPALDALPGANRMPASMKISTASRVVGMLAPSATHRQPLRNRARASSASSSFWVAQGKAMSQARLHGRTSARNSRPKRSASSLMRPRLTFLSSISACHCSSVRPPSQYRVPSESDSEITLPPRSMTLRAAYWATLPEPEMATRLPSTFSPLRLSISSAKYTQPKPVASGRIRLPP
ncbi:hypothetical protein D9M71_522020 [compost metagenome]